MLWPGRQESALMWIADRGFRCTGNKPPLVLVRESYLHCNIG
jgi:hypothetical protein